MIKSIPAGFEPLADVNASSNTIGQFMPAGTLQQNIGSIIQKMNEQGIGNFNTQAQIVYQNMIDVQGLAGAANSISSAKTEIANLFNTLDIYRTSLVAYSPASNGTDVTGFVTAVSNTLSNEKGKVDYLTGKFASVANWMNDLATNVKVLGKGMSTKALQYILNNAPVAGKDGAITYGGKSGLTFTQAANNATLDLLNAGIDFMNDAKAGIKNVVNNKAAADADKLLTSILSVLGGVLGGVSNMASSVAFWFKNSNKPLVGGELYASLAKEAAGNAASLINNTNNALKNALKPTRNALGFSEIRATDDWGQALRASLASVSDVSPELSGTVQRYVSSYNSLVSEMLKATSTNAADNLTKNPNLTPKTGMAVNRTVVDSLSKSPVQIALSYVDFDGVVRNTKVTINPSDWKGVNVQNYKDFKTALSVPGYLTAETWVRAWMQAPGQITLDAVVQGFNVRG